MQCSSACQQRQQQGGRLSCQRVDAVGGLVCRQLSIRMTLGRGLQGTPPKAEAGRGCRGGVPLPCSAFPFCRGAGGEPLFRAWDYCCIDAAGGMHVVQCMLTTCSSSDICVFFVYFLFISRLCSRRILGSSVKLSENRHRVRSRFLDPRLRSGGRQKAQPGPRVQSGPNQGPAAAAQLWAGKLGKCPSTHEVADTFLSAHQV